MATQITSAIQSQVAKLVGVHICLIIEIPKRPTPPTDPGRGGKIVSIKKDDGGTAREYLLNRRIA